MIGKAGRRAVVRKVQRQIARSDADVEDIADQSVHHPQGQVCDPREEYPSSGRRQMEERIEQHSNGYRADHAPDDTNNTPNAQSAHDTRDGDLKRAAGCVAG